jgi:hypothetical protein
VSVVFATGSLAMIRKPSWDLEPGPEHDTVVANRLARTLAQHAHLQVVTDMEILCRDTLNPYVGRRFNPTKEVETCPCKTEDYWSRWN